MIYRRIAIVAAMLSCLLAVASFAAGEESLLCPESATPLDASSYEMRLLSGSMPGTVKLSFGDLKGQCLPSPVVATVVFIINWAKDKQPRTVTGAGQTTLVLPAENFILMKQDAPEQATVRVTRIVIRASSGPTLTSLTFELARQGDAWRVLRTTMP